MARSARELVTTSRLGKKSKAPVWKLLNAVGYDLTRLQVSDEEHTRSLVRRMAIAQLLDVGANQGQYASSFRNRTGFTGNIVSLEPTSEAFKRLSARARPDTSWRTVHAAAGAEVGSLEISVAANSVSSSLLAVSGEHLRHEPGSRTKAKETVRVDRLDNLLESSERRRRSWLKLDVQGYESQVLLGAPETLKLVYVVQAEISFQHLYSGQTDYLELLGILEDRGFVPVKIIPGFSDPVTGDLLQCDVVAMRSEPDQ